MASWYINPGLGSGTNAGTSWANAFNSTTTAWTDAITASLAGDDFYVNSASTVSNGSATTLTFKGTTASPNRVFSCSTITNNPPLSADLGAGAAVTTTGANTITINGVVYIYGVTFNVGTGTSAANFINCATASSAQIYDTCQINLPTTTASSNVNINNVAGGATTFINTPVVFSGGAFSAVNHQGGIFVWKNTSAPAIGNANNSLTAGITIQSGKNGLLICDGVDFSGANGIANNKNVIAAVPVLSNPFVAQFINCKYTATALFGTPAVFGPTIDLIVTDTGATNYKQSRVHYAGTLTQSTTVYNNATDGTTPISWQVVTTANAKPAQPFECFQIVQWAAAGTYAATVVNVVAATAQTRSGNFQTNDVWVDVEYLGSSYALGSPATSFGAGSGSATLPQIPAGTTPGNVPTTGAGNWTAGSLTTPIYFQLTVPSFTTSAAGYVRFTVKVGKASTTLFIDPSVTIA